MLAFAATACADDIVVKHRRLHIDCSGQGSPAVILDAGLGGSSLEWVLVRHRLRTFTRVCSFDRAGYGDSDMGPRPRTSSRIANELYLLLQEADVDGPFILAGHSFGGYNMQLFARRYPYLTAGLVLVDASHPEQVERFSAPPLNLVTAPSSRFGIVQFRDPPPPHEALPVAIKLDIQRRAKRWKTRRTLAHELLGFRDSASELRAAPPLKDVPLIVISRGRIDGRIDEKRTLMEKLWLEMQSELALESDTSAHLIARSSGHNVHIEQPDLVAYGVGLLVRRFRERHAPGTAEVPEALDHLAASDVVWLHDTLNIFPAPTRMAGCGALDDAACAGGAP